MRFSVRTAWELGENDFAAKLLALRRAGRELIDLTVSNPTICGFRYDEEIILPALVQPESLRYEAEAFGTIAARKGVAQYYRDAGAEVPLESICLTTSTSEGYSFLFRLLCDAGDEVLVARPSYPLFDYIARLADVALREYPLLYDAASSSDVEHGWSIDFHALEQAITPRTRAIIVVHPNNPTGHFVSEGERAQLDELCAERELALIVDEVFLDYPLAPPAAPTFAAGQRRALTFVLSGLSKVCGLPQMKCSWIAALGPQEIVTKAMERMEIVADTFLSMSAPIQRALPVWLEQRGVLQAQIRTRMIANLAVLDTRLRGTAAGRLMLQGGWTAVLRVPRHVGGVEFAEAALESGVIVQPGSFYGFPAGRVVLSLLTPLALWAQGLQRLPVD